MSINTAFLRFRMRLNLDPWARAARKRHDQLHEVLECERIRRKAIRNMGGAMNTIIARPCEEDSGTTVMDMSHRERNDSRSLTAITTEGIEVAVYDPTDEVTAELMRRFQMGDTVEHERMAVFGNRVDSERPESIDWEWQDENSDPFSGIKNLG